MGELAGKIHKDHKNVAKSAIQQNVSLHGGAIKILSCQPPQVQLDHIHTIAAHMGQGAPKDMLVTFVIGVDDRQCHKNPIITTIVGTKRFKKVVHCSETWGLPTRKNFWLLQPVSNYPPKRQPNSFNCWILLGWCGNLFRSPPYFHDPCIWQFVQFAVLTFVTVFRCTQKFSGWCQ